MEKTESERVIGQGAGKATGITGKREMLDRQGQEAGEANAESRRGKDQKEIKAQHRTGKERKGEEETITQRMTSNRRNKGKEQQQPGEVGKTIMTITYTNE